MFKYFVLATSWAVYLFETYLDFRQYRNTKAPRPKKIADFITQETYDKSVKYSADKAHFGFLTSFVWQLVNTAVFVYDVMPYGWNKVDNALNGYGGEILHSIVAVSFFFLVGGVLDLPFGLYRTFVIEERHGFNRQTIAIYFTDMLKNYAVGGVILVPLVAILITIIQSVGDNFYLYVWSFMFLFQIFLVSIYPTVIQPLFNKFTPLPSGDLKMKINDLAKKVSFPLTNIFVVDGSRHSNHSNAYLFGFFKNKRIVIYDTLIEQNETKEVLAVLAHEIGHWAHSHTLQMLAVSQTHMLLLLYCFQFFIKNVAMYRDFGFGSEPIIIGFILFTYISTPVEHVVGFMVNMASRTFEFQADAYAKKLGYAADLRSGLIKIYAKNLSNMNPDPLYTAYHYSHPPLLERLDAIAKAE